MDLGGGGGDHIYIYMYTYIGRYVYIYMYIHARGLGPKVRDIRMIIRNGANDSPNGEPVI